MLVAMALTDYVPVILFLMSAILMQRCFYRLMSKGAFALLCAGTIMTILAGTFKATWKLLYNLNICDFVALNKCFFPMQASGFLLTGIAMIALVAFRQKKNKAMSIAPVGVLAVCAAQFISLPGSVLSGAAATVDAVPEFSGTMIFVAMMVVGVACMNIGLAVVSVKLKRRATVILFVLSLFFMLGMGYLSSKDFSVPAMNWIGEIVNIIGQIMLLIGVLDLKKHGLEEKETL